MSHGTQKVLTPEPQVKRNGLRKIGNRPGRPGGKTPTARNRGAAFRLFYPLFRIRSHVIPCSLPRRKSLPKKAPRTSFLFQVYFSFTSQTTEETRILKKKNKAGGARHATNAACPSWAHPEPSTNKIGMLPTIFSVFSAHQAAMDDPGKNPPPPRTRIRGTPANTPSGGGTAEYSARTGTWRRCAGQ